MAITHVNTQTATQANGTTTTVTKPTGTTSGDVLLAFFTSNDQDCTPPAGWTEFSDEFISTFRCQAFYKVAGGSEPASYAFSVAANAPLVCQVSAWRGVDNSNVFDAAVVTASGTSLSEAVTTPTVTANTASGRLIYHRAVRFAGSTVPTFTASGTEISDVGVFSGGSVCYANGLYSASSDYSSSGSKSGLAITCSQAESHNLTMTFSLRGSSIPGTMDVDLPVISSASFAGDVSVPGTMEADLPLPEVDIAGFYGSNEGPLEVSVPIDVSISAAAAPVGTMGVTITPTFDSLGETRYFSDSVVNVVREERWIVVTQDGWYPGIRNTKLSLFVYELPSITAQFTGEVDPALLARLITAVANDASVGIKSSAGTATTSIATNGATTPPVHLANAGHAAVTCHN